VTKKRIRVMIVEDNEATAYMIKKAFSDRGEKVDWDLCFAKDGEAAPLDFVLLDWNLPKVNGKEVLRLFKSDEALRTLAVPIFSASQTDEDVHPACDGHANGFVSKPADMDAPRALEPS
jgi:DNA-binding response OmpR family regulator